MNKNRLEAFSDGVLAIVLTIMVLELKVPHGTQWSDLVPLGPIILSYILSFIYIAIYWNNHHHMLHAVKSVSGPVLWANMHLLFWLSLTPFTTAWVGENGFSPLPVAAYGVVLFLAAIAYFILARTLIASNGDDSALARALGSDFKGKVSTALYAVAVALSWWLPHLAVAIYVAVAVMWVIPDKRIEKVLK